MTQNEIMSALLSEIAVTGRVYLGTMADNLGVDWRDMWDVWNLLKDECLIEWGWIIC